MMTESLYPLVLATVVFVGSHFLLSAGPIRVPLYATLGRRGFAGLYSLVAIASFVWMCLEYRRAPFLDYWPREEWMWWLSLIVMFFASILLACGFLTPNPASVMGGSALARDESASGIFAVTRHPIMWAVTLWAAVHMLATGDAASLVFFGGLAILGFFGMMHIDARRDDEGNADWVRFRSKTSFVPFAAILRKRASFRPASIGWSRLVAGIVLWVLLADGHEWVIGVIVAPWSPYSAAG